MTKERKILLNYLLKQYKQSINEDSLSRKPTPGVVKPNAKQIARGDTHHGKKYTIVTRPQSDGRILVAGVTFDGKLIEPMAFEYVKSKQEVSKAVANILRWVDKMGGTGDMASDSRIRNFMSGINNKMMTKERKILLNYLLKQYKQSLQQKKFVALYDGKQLQVQAETEDKAMRKAQQHFKVINANIGLISVWEKSFYIKKFKTSIKQSIKGKAMIKQNKIATIYVDGYPWHIRMIDSTHVAMSNRDKTVDFDKSPAPAIYHIGQLRNEDYYNDLEDWLHNRKDIQNKHY